MKSHQKISGLKRQARNALKVARAHRDMGNVDVMRYFVGVARRAWHKALRP